MWMFSGSGLEDHLPQFPPVGESLFTLPFSLFLPSFSYRP